MASLFRQIMFSWSSLGPCRNPDCPFKGSCGPFLPQTSLDVANAVATAEALGHKCICSCFGVQHIIVAVARVLLSLRRLDLPSRRRPLLKVVLHPLSRPIRPPLLHFAAMNTRSQCQDDAPKSATSKKEQQQETAE
ncbi:hypothetical protein R3P38DRAFT_3234371 [Favolaschia claudopus]|uniref:Uncharacterized protein n=1 Tax=Favolaschia claudopus TaxID=2862362 RepID=A0AAV9ZHT6_9AGAR